MSHHPDVNLEHWLAVFPMDKLRDENETLLSKYPAWKGRPRTDLRRLSCEPISSPIHLATLEQLRGPIIRSAGIEEATPVDIFLWQKALSEPWLTRLGGVPYRPADRDWPTDFVSGRPYSFIAQISFLDSLDVLPFRPPGDLLLIFFRDAEAIFGDEKGVHLEWVTSQDIVPMPASDCAQPAFDSPQLHGVRYRAFEFPDNYEAFDAVDCNHSYLLPVSQSTKIGTETHFIQGYPNVPDGFSLIATLNSLQLAEQWPLIDSERILNKPAAKNQPYGWGPYEMVLGDVGCLYFFLNEAGSTIWRFDCY